jgi:ketosteroid isomerase-like protein
MTDFEAQFVPEESHPEFRALIERFHALRGQPDEFIKLFQPDAILRLMGDSRDSIFYGEHRGHAQILELMRRTDIEYERLSHRILGILVDGDCIAVRRVLEVRHRGSSQTARLVLGSFFRTRKGLFEEVFEYSDTATAKRLMG